MDGESIMDSEDALYMSVGGGSSPASSAAFCWLMMSLFQTVSASEAILVSVTHCRWLSSIGGAGGSSSIWSIMVSICLSRQE